MDNICIVHLTFYRPNKRLQRDMPSSFKLPAHILLPPIRFVPARLLESVIESETRTLLN
ncbi:MAG: hypothetical protein QOJ99_3170 [Bryobacterales bacterium]|nr:hypothetical protein [Bryobacterales bacterium]